MEASEQLKQVELSLIEISGANPRKDVKGQSFKELKASIAEHGILEPLVVRPKEGRYELVAGERRLTAAKELKFETVPVIIRQLDDRAARVIMLLENLQREDLSPLEEAQAIEELLKDGAMTQQELAKKLGKSQPWIANRVRLLKAPDKLKEYLISGQMTPQHLIALLPYCDKEGFMGQVLRKYDEHRKYRGGVSVEELQGIIDEIIRYDDSGKYALRLDKDDMGWNMAQLAKHMDLSACKTCSKPLVIEDEDCFDESSKKRKVRICLEADCFRPKVNDARKAVKEAEEKKAEKATKSGKLDLDKIRPASYELLSDDRFPKRDCKECEHRKIALARTSSLDGDRSKEREICLNPSCFRTKAAAYEDELDRLYTQLSKSIVDSFGRYVSSRPAGLNDKELLLIYDRIGSYTKPLKKGKWDSGKDLENEILHQAVHGAIDDAYDLKRLRDLCKSLPFEVKGPGAPGEAGRKEAKA